MDPGRPGFPIAELTTWTHGLRPGIIHYPLKLQLWVATAQLDEEKRGPAIASRLEGEPFQCAMENFMQAYDW